MRVRARASTLALSLLAKAAQGILDLRHPHVVIAVQGGFHAAPESTCRATGGQPSTGGHPGCLSVTHEHTGPRALEPLRKNRLRVTVASAMPQTAISRGARSISHSARGPSRRGRRRSSMSSSRENPTPSSARRARWACQQASCCRPASSAPCSWQPCRPQRASSRARSSARAWRASTTRRPSQWRERP